MDTFLRHGNNVLGSRVVDCTAAGVTHEITPTDDGSNFSEFEMAVSVRLERPSPDRVTATIRGRALSTFPSKPVPAVTADAHVQFGVRAHALPNNQNYLLQVDGSVGASWTRAGTSGLGSAGTGITIVNCPGKVITVGTGGGASGTLSKTESVRCAFNTGNQFGFLSEVGASLNAQAVAQDGTSNEASAEAVYAIQVKRVGPEMRPLTGPQETVAGSPLPQAVQVVVVQNDTDAPLPGHSVEFRLKDASGGILDTLTRTTLADGKAEANFVIPAGGAFSVEAVCAACVSGQTAVFPITSLSGELAALPGPREAPVGGSIELTFKATEKVLVEGVAQETPVAGTPVEFTVSGPAEDAAFSPNPATTGPDGVTRTTLTLGSAAGTYEVTATCAACRAKPSEKIAVEASRSAVALVKDTTDDPAAGDGQRAFVGDFLPFRLRVRLQSGGADELMGGVTIQFLVEPPPGAKGSWAFPDSVSTDPSGRASTVLTLGAQPGEYVVRAVCDACAANREVTFTATAQPIPTFVAGWPGDFWGGPSVSLPLNRSLNALLPEIGADITATGNPPGLSYSWEIVKGSDKVRFEGPTDGPMVSLLPLAASVNVNDVEVAVTYGRDFLGRTARAPQRLTVQKPVRIDYAKKAPVNCADFFIEFPGKFLLLPGGLKDAQGPNGRLIPFQATVFDQLGAAFKVPENKRLLVRELGRMIRIDEDAPGLDAKVGQVIERSIPIGAQGTFTDQVGFCEDVPYPAGHLQTVDRCALTGASDLFIQREIVTYSGRIADIGISDELGCPQ